MTGEPKLPASQSRAFRTQGVEISNPYSGGCPVCPWALTACRSHTHVLSEVNDRCSHLEPLCLRHQGLQRIHQNVVEVRPQPGPPNAMDPISARNLGITPGALGRGVGGSNPRGLSCTSCLLCRRLFFALCNSLVRSPLLAPGLRFPLFVFCVAAAMAVDGMCAHLSL